MQKLIIAVVASGLAGLATYYFLSSDPDVYRTTPPAERVSDFQPSSSIPIEQPLPAEVLTADSEHPSVVSFESPMEALKKAVLSEDEAERDQIFSALLHDVSPQDAEAMANYIQNFEKPGPVKEIMLFAYTRIWAQEDSQAAITWAEQQPEWQRDKFLEQVCFGVGDVDPAGAVSLAYERGILEKNPGMVENIAQRWASRDLLAAEQWAKQWKAGETRDRIVTTIAFIQAQKEPQKAAGLVLREISPGSAQNEAIMTVLHQWAVKDPVEARKWVLQFPQSPFKNLAISELDGMARYQKQIGSR